MKQIGSYFVLAFIFVVFLIAFHHALKNKTYGGYILAGLFFLVLVLVAAVGLLDYRVKGPWLEVERRLQKVEVTQEELRKIVRTLTTMVFVLDESNIQDGSAPLAHKVAEGCRKELHQYLGPDFEDHLSKAKEKVRQKQ